MIGYAYRWDNKYDQHPIYIGSCKDDKQRERGHRSDCYNIKRHSYNIPFYKYVRKNGGIEQWKMTVIYIGPEYELFEKNYIKSTWEYNLNAYIPLLTKQERKDNHKITYKLCYENNKEKILEKAGVKKRCDNCGKFVRKDNITKHKKTKKCMAFK